MGLKPPEPLPRFSLTLPRQCRSLTAMKIVTTKTYEKAIGKMLSRNVISQDDRNEMEGAIIADSTSPAIIPGTGGIRKLKWKGSGRGKRGGIRTVYFHHARPEKMTRGEAEQDVIYLLATYPKSTQDDLSQADKRAWRKFVGEIKKEQGRK